MLGAVKNILTKEMDVKAILKKEVDVKEFLEMEIELTKLKQLLATEIKLKEFLVQEIDLNKLLSTKSMQEKASSDIKVVEDLKFEHVDKLLNITSPLADEVESDEIESDEVGSDEIEITEKVKRDLPAFDFSLIETLHTQHKEIRFIFNRLMSFAVEKDYAKVAGQLETFNNVVRKHYKKTDIELYAYLRTYVQIKYPKREKAFTQLSLEMKNNSIEIFYIISQSPSIPMSEKTYNAFMKEFMAVGKLMNERINREKELLFKMYEQTNSAKNIS